MFRLSFLIIAVFLAAPAGAQLDSSSAVLLRPSGKSIAPENLDSSRYKVRMPESKKDDEELDEKPGTMIPSPVPARPPRVKVKAVESAPAPATEAKTEAKTETKPATNTGAAGNSSSAPAPSAPEPASATAPATPPDLHPVSSQVRELILGGSSEDIEEYRKQIHPEDPRANVLSISFAPAYFYTGSNSEYSFRRYSANGPGFGASMNLWLTPFFGLQSKYFSSVTAGVRGGPTNMVPMDVQLFEAGLRFRKHFGYSRKAARLSWGLDYHDASDKISRDSSVNVGRRSSGLNFALEAEVPTSNTYAHTFEVGIQPRMHHSEPATSVQVKSGSKNETNAISLSVGGEWILDRRNQVFWRTQYNVERNLFQGPANTVDPASGQTPNGVSVTDSLLIFYFGFKWGS